MNNYMKLSVFMSLCCFTLLNAEIKQSRGNTIFAKAVVKAVKQQSDELDELKNIIIETARVAVNGVIQQLELEQSEYEELQGMMRLLRDYARNQTTSLATLDQYAPLVNSSHFITSVCTACHKACADKQLQTELASTIVDAPGLAADFVMACKAKNSTLKTHVDGCSTALRAIEARITPCTKAACLFVDLYLRRVEQRLQLSLDHDMPPVIERVTVDLLQNAIDHGVALYNAFQEAVAQDARRDGEVHGIVDGWVPAYEAWKMKLFESVCDQAIDALDEKMD